MNLDKPSQEDLLKVKFPVGEIFAWETSFNNFSKTRHSINPLPKIESLQTLIIKDLVYLQFPDLVRAKRNFFKGYKLLLNMGL